MILTNYMSFGYGVWADNSYVILTPADMDTDTGRLSNVSSFISTSQTATPTKYIQSAIDPKLIVAGLVKLQSGILVALLWRQPIDGETYVPEIQRTYGAWSFDNGKTFSVADSYSEVIPQLECPPALVSLQNWPAAVWIDRTDNLPRIAVSEDHGQNWNL